jgi:GH15 family glucan-1,4-alpha-glucosidase
MPRCRVKKRNLLNTSLDALLITGYTNEAAGWARWLRRAVAGSPGEFQIMYGVGGERRLTEFELDRATSTSP